MLIIAVLVIAFFVLVSGFRIVQQWQRGLVFRLGRYIGLREPGLTWIVPLGIDKMVRVDLRVLTDAVEQQEAMTKDNVPVKVNAVIWYRVTKPDLAVIEVADVRNAVIQSAPSCAKLADGK